jgi:hypothetical protein
MGPKSTDEQRQFTDTGQESEGCLLGRVEHYATGDRDSYLAPTNEGHSLQSLEVR